MKHVKLQRLPDDPICIRASIGGDDRIGYYCLFRGDQAKVIEMIEMVLLVMQHAPKLEIEEDTPQMGMS
jgi:hypothetical protein